MNSFKLAPLALALSAVFVAGCNRADESGGVTSGADSTANQNYGSSGTTAPADATTGSSGTLGTTGTVNSSGTTTGSNAAGTSSSTGATGMIGSPDTSSMTAGGSGTPAETTGSATGGAVAQGTGAAGTGTVAGSGGTGSSGQLASGDAKFVQQAAASNLFEVEVARMASEKATRPEVKQFASMLMDHHAKATAELASLASTHGVSLPAAMPASKRNDLEDLGKLSGAEFDRRFMKEVGLEAHEADVRMFETASKNAKNAELKAWVDKTLPTLKQHLSQAQTLARSTAAGKS